MIGTRAPSTMPAASAPPPAITTINRVRADAPDIGRDALDLIPDGEPIDELPLTRARPPPGVMPAPRIKSRRLEALRQQAPHHLVGEGLHATVGVVNDEEFLRSEQLVTDDQGANRVIGGTAAGIPNYMRIAFRQTRKFGRVKTRIHAG